MGKSPRFQSPGHGFRCQTVCFAGVAFRCRPPPALGRCISPHTPQGLKWATKRTLSRKRPPGLLGMRSGFGHPRPRGGGEVAPHTILFNGYATAADPLCTRHRPSQWPLCPEVGSGIERWLWGFGRGRGATMCFAMLLHLLNGRGGANFAFCDVLGLRRGSKPAFFDVFEP